MNTSAGIILTVILLYFLPDLNAQKEAWNWQFGDHVNMSFSSGNPVVSFNSAISSGEGCSTISDTTGNLLMYCSSDTVWNRMHQAMPNGSDMKGNYSSTQSALLIRQPGSYSNYYLFTVDCIENGGAGGMNFSVIDMNLDNGLGDVVIKNVPLVTPSSEKLTAVLHHNKKDIWVIGHSVNDNRFYAYLLSSSGLDTVPVVTAIGASYSNPNGNAGYMKASPNGRFIACATHMSTFKSELFEFNDSTGILSNYIPLIPSGNTNFLYGVEFSFNSKYLYLTHNFVSQNSFAISQIDITSLDPFTILNSQTVLDNSSSFMYNSLQLAPDNHIYVLRSGFNYDLYLDRINFPDAAGLNCQYERNVVNITNPSTPSGSIQSISWGLPNMLVSLFDLDTTHTTAYTGLLLDSELFNIYPNPVYDEIEINCKNGMKVNSISIMDLSGRQLIRQDLNAHINFSKIRVDQLLLGTYFLEIKTVEAVGRQRFVVR